MGWVVTACGWEGGGTPAVPRAVPPSCRQSLLPAAPPASRPPPTTTVATPPRSTLWAHLVGAPGNGLDGGGVVGEGMHRRRTARAPCEQRVVVAARRQGPLVRRPPQAAHFRLVCRQLRRVVSGGARVSQQNRAVTRPGGECAPSPGQRTNPGAVPAMGPHARPAGHVPQLHPPRPRAHRQAGPAGRPADRAHRISASGVGTRRKVAQLGHLADMLEVERWVKWIDVRGMAAYTMLGCTRPQECLKMAHTHPPSHPIPSPCLCTRTTGTRTAPDRRPARSGRTSRPGSGKSRPPGRGRPGPGRRVGVG